MSYETYEESVEDGEPVELYLFRYGTDASAYYAYTNHTQEIAESGITYAPRPVKRDGVEADGTIDRSTISVGLDIGSEVAELFRVYPPSHVVTLTIKQGHLSDGNYQVVWAGRVVAASREGSAFKVSGEPVATQLRRPGLRRHYQYGCMHQLYGPQCRADKASKTVTSLVEAVSGTEVTLADGWTGAFFKSKFLRGLLEWTNEDGGTEQRTILRIDGDTLTLSGIVRDLDVGDSADAIVGCNHQAFAAKGGDCEGLHDNILNFGGCPWIPTKNPINAAGFYY